MLYAAPVEGVVKRVKEKAVKKPKLKIEKPVKPIRPKKQKAKPEPVAEPEPEPVAEPEPEPVAEPEPEPVAEDVKHEPMKPMIKPEPAYETKKDDTTPPSWFVTFIKNTKKQEAAVKTKKNKERAPETIAKETWNNDYKRQRIEEQSNHHMKQMHNLYNQMFYR